MKVLVAYASRHGATEGIAERIAGTLQRHGLDVTIAPAANAGGVSDYDAFVIGSAAYAFHWLKDASRFVRRHEQVLASRPVWLFSSGPLGPDKVDEHGRDAREAAQPREFAEFGRTITPRDHRVFFGAYDPAAEPVGFMEKVMHAIPAARDAMPGGDFRDWADVDAWAEGIAQALTAVPATGSR
jgi:menaquinone-dependent protoporphyrinogen oxidase